MNALTSLPFEIQDYIFDFDGRYKIAMKKTLYLIEEWGKTTVNGEFSWSTKSPFNLEAERRAEMYSRHLGDDNVIRLRHAVIDARIKGIKGCEFYHLFKDVLGAYSIMAKPRTILVDGEEYKSTKFYKYVGKLTSITRNELRNAIGTTTRESRFYLLDPKVQKKLRRTNSFLEHGLSLNGKHVKKVFKTKPKPVFVFNPATDREVYIDDVSYYIRNDDIISIDGRIVAMVDGDDAVWLGDER